MFLQNAVLALLVAAATPPTLTVPAAEDPEALIKQGNQLRQEGEDLRAEGYFRRAYQVAKTGRTAAQFGLVELAIEAYLISERYLSEALNSDDAWVKSNAKVIEQSRAVARRNLVRLEITGIPDNVTASTGNAPIVRLNSNGSFWIEAGGSSVRLDAPGYRPTTVHVDGRPGDVKQIAVLMLPEQRRTPMIWPEVAVGVLGLSAGIVGSMLYAEGASEKKAIESEAQRDVPYDPSNKNWSVFRKTGAILGIGGAVALVASGCLLIWSGAHSEGDGLEVNVGPSIGSVEWKGTFQ